MAPTGKYGREIGRYVWISCVWIIHENSNYRVINREKNVIGCWTAHVSS